MLDQNNLQDAHPMTPFRRTVLVVAGLNFAYFGVEFAVALAIGSVALFADSIDFLEDTSVNLLVFAAALWSAQARRFTGMVLAAFLIVPSLAALWTVWEKMWHFTPPDAGGLAFTGAGAFAVNLFCSFLLAPYRKSQGSLSRAAFLSARNDAIANLAIVGAGFFTAWLMSAWPDLVVGLGIALINADAAREVFSAAQNEEHAPAP